jgi:hypothetical protein
MAQPHHAEAHQPPAIHFYNKINPLWWFGNIDEPVSPDWYRPGENFRDLTWYLRNPPRQFQKLCEVSAIKMPCVAVFIPTALPIRTTAGVSPSRNGRLYICLLLTINTDGLNST